MAKADLITEAQEKGIPLTGEETVAELEALIAGGANAAPAAAAPAAEVPPPVAEVASTNPGKKNAPADFSFAANSVKLNRAKAWVNANPDHDEVRGKKYVDAVKARYIKLGGLTAGERAGNERGVRGGRVVNMAADDGSDE